MEKNCIQKLATTTYTMRDNNIKKFNKEQLNHISEKLKSNRFDSIVFEEVDPAVNHILSIIGNNKTIGVGGSQTVRSIGLIEKLKEAKNEIITHTPDMDKETRIKTWLKAQSCEFYFASPQAITYDGELLFIDAYGNRTSAVTYGPKKVILVAGYNKIVKDINTGLWRIRNISAMANNIRLERKNPCVVTGKCEDCDSKTRICNVVTILYKKPDFTDYLIVLINESLGY